MDNLDLEGYTPAYKDGIYDCYTTNYGQARVVRKNNKVASACIGIGRNQGNERIAIKIEDGEFIAYRDNYGTSIAESIQSPKYPYKTGNTKYSLDKLLNVIEMDNNIAFTAVVVKIALLQLIKSKLHITKEQENKINTLLKVMEENLKIPIERRAIKL